MRIKEANLEALLFRLGNEEYGVDILKVQEIRGRRFPVCLDAIDRRLLTVRDIERMVSSEGPGRATHFAA